MPFVQAFENDVVGRLQSADHEQATAVCHLGPDVPALEHVIDLGRDVESEFGPTVVDGAYHSQ